MSAVLKPACCVLSSPLSSKSSLSDRRRSMPALSFRLAPVIIFAAICVAWNAPTARAQTNFGSVNVCPSGATPAPCNTSLTLTYNVAAGTTIGSIKILTLGAPNLDFQAQANDTRTTLCKPQTYPSATTCTVDVTFAPLYAGERSGAVQIFDASENLVAATSLYGTGTAPAIAFTPASQSSLTGGGFGKPAGIAIDGSGNIFVADFVKDAVYEMLASGGFTTVKTLGGGFAFGKPSGIAVDGAGNAFVSDYANRVVYEILAAGGYATVNTLGGGFVFGQPSDVALDASGNVYVSDLDSAVYIIPSAGGVYPAVARLAIGFSFGRPSGLAVDGNDNVYITDVSKNAVYEILAAGDYTKVNQLTSSFGFKSLLGVAASTNGNIFIADGDFATIFEILASGGYTTVLPLGSGYASPQSVALDASGNVYVGDLGVAGTPSPIQVLERSQPPAFSFATTVIHGTSSDSPRSVQFENIGNQPLSGTGVLSDTLDFTVVAGPGTVPDCNGVISLALGTLCNVSFSFSPQSLGPLSSTFTLSDNALNRNPATQTIPLSGTGEPPPPQINTISPNSGIPGTIIAISGTDFGATQGNSSVTVGGAPPTWFRGQIR